MNRFNIIIIIGVTGTGKSLLAARYLASHPDARLIDSLELKKAPAKVISFKSENNIRELANCDTLLIDELFEAPWLATIAEIFAYRAKHGKKTVILSQQKENVERIFNSVKIIDEPGVLLYLGKDTDIQMICSFLDLLLSIRSDCPLVFKLWCKEDPSMPFWDEQEQHLAIAPEEWNLLLDYSAFWELVLQSNMQSLVIGESGEIMKNGSVGWAIAKSILKRLVSDMQLSHKMKESLNKILTWVDENATGHYELGINFISSNTVEL